MDERITEMYFNWICRLIVDERLSRYGQLLRFLFDKPFVYILAMDGNRESDGIDLRYRFGKERGLDYRYIATHLDIFPCSVLEMMVALCIRCEGDIMDDPDYGDRTSLWFWHMLNSLGLLSLKDGYFSRKKAHNIIHRFLYRKYLPNGKGGLFTLDTDTDLRNVEIWFQAMWWCNAYLKGEVL